MSSVDVFGVSRKTLERRTNSRPSILVVDDDDVQRMIVSEALRQAGYRCIEAGDGDTALEMIGQAAPDAVLLDVMMPGRDGYSVCTELRADEALASMPIIMVTGLDDMASIDRAFDVGATDFVSKPVNLALLPHHLRYVLRNSAHEADLRRARDLAWAGNQAKTEFLAAVGHELRTPLNAVIGFSELMRDEIFGPLGTDEYTQYAHVINSSANGLLMLINDILDYTALDKGGITVREQIVSVSRLVDDAVAQIQEVQSEISATLTKQAEESWPDISCDVAQMTKILRHLLSNAIKFTHEDGQICIEASVADDGSLLLRVQDNGIGIEPEQLANIMKHFTQAESGLDRRHEGLGLGLSLAHAMTELHGGTLKIESTSGMGTCASICLPTHCVATAA